jgi:hypothetical protein
MHKMETRGQRVVADVAKELDDTDIGRRHHSYGEDGQDENGHLCWVRVRVSVSRWHHSYEDKTNRVACLPLSHRTMWRGSGGTSAVDD